MTNDAASSEETLVDGLHFVLSHDNPMHTTIRGPGRQRLYQVTSTSSPESTTTIKKYVDQDGRDTVQEVATIYWSKMGLHKVRVMGRQGAEHQPVKATKILRSGPLFSEIVSFEDELGRKYDWHGSQTASKLRLYSSDDPSAPIAKFQRSKRDELTGGRLKAYLKIEPRGQELLDTVVWTFCYLEKGRRDMTRARRL